MEFKEVPVPTGSKRGRPALPNPYVDLFPTRVDDQGEPLAQEAVVPAHQNSVEVRRLVRQARQAARDKNLTAHIRVDEDRSEDSEEGPLTRVTVWTTERV